MWSLIFSIALKGVDWYLNKVKADDEIKRKWLDFIKATQSISKASVKIMESHLAQRDRVREMEEQLKQGEKKDEA